mgnify:FL=1
MFYNEDDLRVKDLKVDDKGIFHYINEIKPFPFTELIPVKSIDLGFQMLHGEKRLSPFVIDRLGGDINDNTMKELAKIIVSMFGNKWDTIISLYEKELNLDTYKLTTIEQVDETGEVSNIRTDKSSSERENLISAFNSEDFSNEGKEINIEDSNITDTGTKSNLKNVTKEVKGNINNRLDDFTKIVNILKTNVINDIIYLDVIRLIGLSIY